MQMLDGIQISILEFDSRDMKWRPTLTPLVTNSLFSVSIQSSIKHFNCPHCEGILFNGQLFSEASNFNTMNGSIGLPCKGLTFNKAWIWRICIWNSQVYLRIRQILGTPQPFLRSFALGLEDALELLTKMLLLPLH